MSSDADYRMDVRQWQETPSDPVRQLALWRSQRRFGIRPDDNEPGKIPDRFLDHNWGEAFGVAGESGVNLGPDIRPAYPTSTVSLEPFDRTNVRKIFQAVDGERDGTDWAAVFELWDGRLASLSAGCDYTGWD
jgi:hypothetical protein